MRELWLVVFAVSSLLLLAILFRNPKARRWIGSAALHIVSAALMLYLVNLAGSFYDFSIPVNAATVGSVLFLGLPGLLMLIGLKAVLF